MARPQLRPLSVGETLDAVFSIYRDRFSAMVTIIAVILVPVGILSAIIQSSMFTTVGDLNAGRTTIGGAIIVSILGWVAQLLATAAVTKAVAGEYLGRSLTWQEAIAGARSHLGALIGASILIAIGVGIGFILLVIPGLFLLVSWALAVPAIVVEDLGATEGIGRSWALVSGRRWPILGVFVVLYIILFIVGALLGLLLNGLFFSGMSPRSSVLVSGLISTVSQVVTAPLLAIGITVVYFDQRVRKEGFDLELLANQVGSSAQMPAADPGIQPPSSDTNPPPEAGDAWPPSEG